MAAPVVVPYNPGSYPAPSPGSVPSGQMPFFGTNYGNYDFNTYSGKPFDPGRFDAFGPSPSAIAPRNVRTETVRVPPVITQRPVQPSRAVRQIAQVVAQMARPQQPSRMQGFVPSPNAPPGAPTYGQSVNNAGRTLGYDYTPGSRAVTQGGVNYGQIPAGPGAAPGAMTAVGNAGGYSNIGGVPTFTPGTGPGGMYGGSGSASVNKVICTAYKVLGWLPENIWRADMRAATTYSASTRAGYLLWGTPLAKIIRRSPLVSVLVWPFAKAWATEMAYKMGAHPHGSVFGKLLEIVCVPICWLIGNALLRRTREVTA